MQKASVSQPMRIFISYTSVDCEWAEWIAWVLQEAGHEPRLQAWHFQPSENFVLRMQQEAENADATIAVLSEDYFKSDFTAPEWAAAFVQDPQGKKRRLIPVRVRECQPRRLFDAIIYVDLVGLDEAQARTRLLDAFKESGVPDHPPKFPGQPATARRVQAAPFPAGLGRLYGNLPSLPTHYLERQQYLTDLRQKLISPNGGKVGVEGMGGVGKTVLAAALARDAQVRAAFPDDIYWLTVGQQANIRSLQAELAKWCGADMAAITGGANAKEELSRALAGRRVLVVLDDVWQIDDMTALDVVSESGRLLITTRNREVLVSIDAAEHKVKVLTPEESLRLLAMWAGADSASALPLEAAEVAKECGFLPLALAMIGAMVRLRPSAWGDALEQLRQHELEEFRRLFPDYLYPNLMRAIAVSVDALEAVDRNRYLDLAVFLEDEAVPEGALQVLWGLNPSKTRRCVDRLVDRSLATVKQRTDDVMLLSLHDLQNNYVCTQREQALSQLHGQLLTAYAAKCQESGTIPQNIVGHGRTATPWHLGPNDGYFFRRLLWHMAQAGRQEQLVDLLRDYRWLQAKLAATDVSALLEDYKELSEPYEEIGLIGEAIRLSVPAVSADSTQLAPQLLGRLLGSRSTGVTVLLEQCRQWKGTAWLRPLRCSLTQPGGVLRFILRGHSDWVNAVAITPDDERAVSASLDGTVRLWDLKHGIQLATLSPCTDEYIAAVITPDGKHVISAEGNGHFYDYSVSYAVGPEHSMRVFVWDLASLNLVYIKDFGNLMWGSIRALGLSPDGRLVFTNFKGAINGCFWELEVGEGLSETECTESDSSANAGSEQRSQWIEAEHISAVAFITDKQLVCCSGENPIIWDSRNHKIIRTLPIKPVTVNSYPHPVCVTTCNSRFVIAGCADHTVKVWDLETEDLPRVFIGHTDKVLTVALDWSKHQVVSGSADKTVRVWDLETGTEQYCLAGHDGAVRGVAITRDGKTIVSASADSTLRVWNLERAGKQSNPTPHTSTVSCVAVTADGKKAISCAGNVVKVWDVETGVVLDTIERSQGESISGVGIGPNGKKVFIVLRESVVIYDLQKDHEFTALPYELMRNPGNIMPLTTNEGLFFLRTIYPIMTFAHISFSGDMIDSGNFRIILQVWDVEHSNVIIERVIHTHRGSIATMTADGRIAVSDDSTIYRMPGSLEKQRRGILVWNVEGGKEPFWEKGKLWLTDDRGEREVFLPAIEEEQEGEILSIDGFRGKITTLGISSDGHRAVSASEDLTLRIWNLNDGSQVASFSGDSIFTACAISSDGTTIIAGDSSGQVHLLRLEEPSNTEDAR